MCLDALTEFTATMGFSKNMVSMSTDKLWTLNKKFIDKFALKYTAFPKNNATTFTIDYNGHDKVESTEVIKYKRSEDKSTRTLYFHNKVFLWDVDLGNVKNGEEVTLMNWGNAYIDTENRILKLHLAGNFKKTKNKLLWLPTNRTMDITILKYKKTGAPRTERTYIGEDQMLNIQKGDHVQLLKLNFFKCDSVDPLNLIIT